MQPRCGFAPLRYRARCTALHIFRTKLRFGIVDHGSISMLRIAAGLAFAPTDFPFAFRRDIIAEGWGLSREAILCPPWTHEPGAS